jgi:hypothetical protein
VIARVFDVARRNSVGAVLCAGDLFDDPTPSEDFWEGLAKFWTNLNLSASWVLNRPPARSSGGKNHLFDGLARPPASGSVC